MAFRLSRRSIARQVASDLVSGDDNAITRLAAFLIDNRRINESELIIRDIEMSLMDSGVVVADITSASSISDDLRNKIKSFVVSSTSSNNTYLREHIDKGVIGGIAVKTPDAEYDATVRNRLKTLKQLKV